MTELGGQSGGGSQSSGGQSGGNGGQSSGDQSGGNGGQSNGGQSGGTGGGGSLNGGAGGRATNEGGQSGGGDRSTGGASGSGGTTVATGGVTDAGGTKAGSGGAGSGGASGTGGTTSTVGVTINGKFVPKEKAVTFIHIGHSNMRGQATTPTSLKSYFYNTEDGLWSYRGSYSLAKEPTAPEGSTTYAGPGMAILHSARAAAGSSDVQFISIGYGVGSKTSVDYLKSGTYYPIFMNWAGQLKGKVTFAAIVIMLGITERHLASDQIPKFPDRIAQIVSDIRADLGEPDLPALFCDYEQLATGDLAPTGSVGSVLMPLVRQIPSKVSKLVLVPTDKLGMQDDHHFDMQGQKDWAERVISLMQTNNWFKWK